MNVIEIIAMLREKGVELSFDAGNLRVRGNKQALSDSRLVELIRQHKQDILQSLASGEHVGAAGGLPAVPPNLIPPGCTAITPDMLPLATLSQHEIDRIVASVPGGAGNIQDIYPLAPLQEGILFHHLLETDGDVYILTSLVAIDTRERLEQYIRARQTIVDRHDTFRTAFLWEGLPEPMQVVLRQVELTVEEIALDPAQGDIGEQLRARFDPRHYRIDVRHPPLWRAFVAHDAVNQRWVMLELAQHLITDHTTGEVLREELAVHLRGEQDRLPPPMPYRNFVAHTRQASRRAEHEAFFTQLLHDVDEPTAAFGLTNVQGDGSQTLSAHRQVDGALAHRLRVATRSLGVSVASVCHVAWAHVLGKLSGRDDVVFGTMMFGRMYGGEGVDRAVGLFINTLPVRIQLGTDDALTAVRKTHALLTDLMRHEHASLALAQRCSAVRAPAPLFTAMLNYRYESHEGEKLATVASEFAGWEDLFFEERINYPIGLAVNDTGDALSIDVQSDPAIDPQYVCELTLAVFQRMIDALEQRDPAAMKRLPVLPASEHRHLLTWGDGGASAGLLKIDTHSTLYDLLTAQAQRTPDALAMLEADRTISYRQLAEATYGVAHHLREHGIAVGDRIGLIADRSIEALIGLLGILGAGAAYVPLDPDAPLERLGFVLEHASIKQVLTPAALHTRAQTIAALRPGLADTLTPIAQVSPRTEPVRSGAGADDAAYLIYTSGTSGVPKGVLVDHRSAMHFVEGFLSRHDFVEQRVLMIPPLIFDASVGDIFPVLAVGSTLVLHPNPTELDAPTLQHFCAEHAVTAIDVPAALWRRWTEEFANNPALAPVLPSIRMLMFGGESVVLDQVRRFAQLTEGRVTLHNHYGPTETTVCALMLTTADASEFDGVELPIGTPLPGVRLYVLDSDLQLVPRGVEGDLYIGGVGVARGYLGDAVLTAERFLSDPFVAHADARMYNSGDRVRWNADGTLQFLGRRDQQVKIRGFRIELGEIEARLAAHNDVREAVVLAREDRPGDKRLVAYVIPVEGSNLSADVLRVHLREALPEYMVPAAYVTLESFPLTPNGKLDRKALPAPEADAFITRTYEAPMGEVEQVLAQIWADVLKVERVGRQDHFFELGGHSLLAAMQVSRVRQLLGVEVPLKELFAQPELAAFAEVVRRAERSAQPELRAVSRDKALPLLFAQQRLWFLAQMEGGSEAYHMPMTLRLQGQLNRAALQRALDRLIARHEALRTTFVQAGEQVVQRIAAAEAGFALRDVDLGAEAAEQRNMRLHASMLEESRTPFDLQQGPLIRGRLIRLSDNEHVLAVTMHHIVSDGWSMGILLGELGALYRAYVSGQDDPLPALSWQYADYAVWQRNWLSGDTLARQTAYWERALAGAPAVLELPTDRPRPARQSYSGATVPVRLDASLTRRLKALSQQHGVTLYMTLLAAWSVVLSRLSGQDDVVIGTSNANRSRAEVEGLIGFFINTQAMRLRVSGAFTALLAQAKSCALDAQAHQEVPFEHIVEAIKPPRSLAHTPIFQVLLVWQNTAVIDLDLPGLTVASAPIAYEIAKYDQELDLGEVGDCIEGELRYATALFDEATIARHMGYLNQVLEALVSDPTQTVEQVDLLSAVERHQLLEGWNPQQADYPYDTCLHAAFTAQAARTPTALAIVHDDRSLTYAELERQSNQLARFLQAQGVGVGMRVALCGERSIALVVGILGVIKTGAAYVPLDPNYPAERLKYLLDDSAAVLMLTQGSGASAVNAVDACPVRLDLDDHAVLWNSDDDTALEPQAGLHGSSPLYVMYTSGSTGLPKGVEVPHRAVSRVVVRNGYAAFNATDRVAFAANPAFDASTLELWTPLLNGGTSVIVDQAVLLEPTRFAQLLIEQAVTAMWLTVGLFNQYAVHLKQVLPHLRYLIVGGDVLDPATIGWVLRECKPQHLLNGYGPTETTTFATVYEITDVPEGRSIPIGRPITQTQVYILDAQRQLVPSGTVGEIHIGGAGVALGYLNRPELTAERFIESPFVAGARLYKTGDLGRWLPDGTIEYRGRNDFQVKLRGFRIELGEIEARLLEHASVREAVVLAREDDPGDKRLVAYILAADAVPSADTLRTHLTGVLPEYMVPAAYVMLEAFPLTSNGKLDRKALPSPDGDAFTSRVYEAPVGETEQALAQIWSEILKVEQIGRHDHFFELGGHSLLAATQIARIRQVLGVEVALKDLFAQPELAAFAAIVAQAERSVQPALIPLARHPVVQQVQVQAADNEIPLSFAQQRLWFLAQMEGGSAAYHMPLTLRLQGKLKHFALQRALDRLVARHEALRTTFVRDGDRTVQRIAASDIGFMLDEHDLSDDDETASTLLMQRLADEANAPFDLEHGPLIRGQLIRLGSNDYALAITMHHIVSDGWSLGIFINELSTLYSAFVAGQGDPLPPLSMQYADYAIWQRRWLTGDVLSRQTAYWERTLSGAPALLELPTDRPRPPQQSHAGAGIHVHLDAPLTRGLKAVSQRHGMTVYMTVLAAWSVVLSRLSGQRDVVIGMPTANRTRTELEGLIGFFVNTLALRINVAGTFSTLLAQAKERSLDAQSHQDVPFEYVVETIRPLRSLAHTPIFQVMFNWQSTDVGQTEQSGLSMAPMRADYDIAKFDQELDLGEAGDCIEGVLTYATTLFDKATIERQIGYLRRVLDALVADPNQPVEHIALLDQAERNQLLFDWNATQTEDPQTLCIHQLFEQQVTRTPDALALVFDQQSLTYAQLNAQANRLAHYLIEQEIRPDDRIAICVQRSIAMVVALMAILKAGAAYVPLEADYPSQTLQRMLDDGSPTLLLLDAMGAERLSQLDHSPTNGLPRLQLELDSARWADHAAHDIDPAQSGLQPQHRACVIYTSGSTDAANGVMHEHGGIVNRLLSLQKTYGLTAHDVVLQKTPIAFDASVREIFWPLMAGARVVIARPAAHNDPAYLSELIRNAGVTTLHVMPSLLRAFLEQNVSPSHNASLVRVICSGETLSAALVRSFHAKMPGVTLHNLYGPTEAAADVTANTCAPGENRAGLSLGRPAANTRIYIVDQAMQPVPLGTTGELCIGGVQVARGYLNRAALSVERFIQSPFVDGERLFKTGDLGRWLPDGSIHYRGRSDAQLSVRGFRVALGEIEACVAEHESVRDAVVLARDDHGSGEQRLVAYVTPAEGATLTPEVLHRYLSSALPEYMVPAAYVMLAALPLMLSGKPDRKALPVPNASAYTGHVYEAPEGELELAIARIWTDLLMIERVGRHTHFFESGGHSMLAICVVAELRTTLGIELALPDLFANPVLKDLAHGIVTMAEAPPADASAHALKVRGGTQTPLFLVHDGYGDVLYFPVLANQLPTDVPVYGLPGVSLDDPTLRTMPAIAAHMIAMMQRVQPVGPYRLAGWSFGGVLAYEIAAQLIEHSEQVDFLGLIDAFHPQQAFLGDLIEKTPEEVLREFCAEHSAPAPDSDFDALFQHYRQLAALPENFAYLTAKDAYARCRSLIVYAQVMHAYAPAPIDMPIDLFIASERDADFPHVPSPMLGWERCVDPRRIRVQAVPGNHESLMRAPHVQVLGRYLTEALNAEPVYAVVG